MVRTSRGIASLVAATLFVGVAAAGGGAAAWQGERSNSQALATQARTIAELERKFESLETQVAAQPDWQKIADAVEPSVFTIETDNGLGSGWVFRSDASGSDVLTNYHVVAEAWEKGVVEVDVRQGDRTLAGRIVKADSTNDLAVVHVAVRLPALTTIRSRLNRGTTVMAVGSPLGLGGSISVGVVSGYRSLAGSDYLQFSAPISPGNSGGPVVDRHGTVVGVATAKLVGDGVEGLGFAIPVQVACITVITCAQGAGP